MTDTDTDTVRPGPMTPGTAEMYERHASELVKFATVLVGPDDANDVVSSVVLKLLDFDWSGVRDEKAFLFRAVANGAKNWRRGESRRRTTESKVQAVAIPPPGEPDLQARAAVLSLSVRQRAVVYLTYWEDMSDQTAAEYLGISPGSVRQHLARAKRRLKGKLS